MSTVDHNLTEEWTLIASGPTTDPIFIEAPLRPLYFRVSDVLPTSQVGHRLDDDTHGQVVTLSEFDRLYARALSGSSVAVVTGG